MKNENSKSHLNSLYGSVKTFPDQNITIVTTKLEIKLVKNLFKLEFKMSTREIWKFQRYGKIVHSINYFKYHPIWNLIRSEKCSNVYLIIFTCVFVFSGMRTEKICRIFKVNYFFLGFTQWINKFSVSHPYNWPFPQFDIEKEESFPTCSEYS